jgi:hypothetical protein
VGADASPLGIVDDKLGFIEHFVKTPAFRSHQEGFSRDNINALAARGLDLVR